MTDCYLGEIRMFAGNYAPNGWAFCDGSALSIGVHTALHGLIGITYGGDGQITFNLPDLRGRLPLHMGQGPGLTSNLLGDSFGEETATPKDIPAHSHVVNVGGALTGKNPQGNYLGTSVAFRLYSAANPDSVMHPLSVGKSPVSAAALPHPNVMPALCVNFIIALEGEWPHIIETNNA